MRRNPGLDALRALASLAVLSLHCGFAFAGGAYVGVDIFFVMSGYLIAGMLLADVDRDGRLHLRRFWRRRAWRLLPALGVVVAAVVVLSVAGLVAPVPGDLPRVLAATALYVGNWAMAGDAASFGSLQQTWSLAVEEQFYVLFPVVLLVCRRRTWLTAVCAVGAVVSGLLLAVLWVPTANPAAYYRTDTRVGPLLLGCLLALAHRRWPAPPERVLRVLRPVTALCLVLLLGVLHLLDAGLHQALAFRGGLQVGWLLCAGAVAGCLWCLPASWARACSWRPVHLLAVSSYATYLWNPVVVFVLHRGEGPVPHATGALAAALSTGLGIASWYLLEQPLSRRARARELRPARVTAQPVLASTSA